MDWVNIVGLFSDAVGAVFLTYGLLISKERAVELSVSRLAGKTVEENLRLPAVADRRRQSRNAAIGLFFLLLGFTLQIVAAWPTWAARASSRRRIVREP
jgi:hypothetical protein